MANGQEKGQQTVLAFDLWASTQTENDYLKIIHRGKLNRGEIAKAISCGKSALNQNPILKKRLEQLEEDLRLRGVLPLLTDNTKPKNVGSKSSAVLKTHNASTDDLLTKAEIQLVELKAENKVLKERLAKYEELSEAISEWGFLPR